MFSICASIKLCNNKNIVDIVVLGHYLNIISIFYTYIPRTLSRGYWFPSISISNILIVIMDIVSIIERVVSLGQQIMERLEAHKEAVASLKKLEIILEQLKNVVFKITEANIDKSHVISIKDTLERTQNVYMKCVEELNVKEKLHRNKFVVKKIKQAVGIYKAPSILADIQRTIQDVEYHLNITDRSLSIIQRAQASATPPKITSTSTSTSTMTSSSILNTELREALTNTIDELVTRLKSDCQRLQEKLDRCTLSIEPSFFEGLGSDNPEAISFWRDHFRSAELSISSIAPYENMYVSWARFIHELEITFQLKNIPTATKESYFGSIDAIRQHGNRYYIDPAGTRKLGDIRPLWLPALRQALDPLHKGYIKPHDYLSFLGGESLSNKLRQVVFDSCGYGIVVECQRTSDDISLPSEIESPAHQAGWMSSCQIVSVPSPTELGVFTYDTQPQLSNLIENFTHPKNDVWVYVRYLQTGQIERKLLSKNVRMLGGLRIGITISVCYILENGSSAWSDSLPIVELKACAGGRYIVTAGSNNDVIEFVTKPPIGFDDRAVRIEYQSDDSTDLMESDYSLLGSSTVFTQEPKIGEKIQVRADGLWYEVRVTAVNGEYVEYVDWSSTSDPTEETESDNNTESDDDYQMGFTDDQLTTLEKGESKIWCPWAQGISNSDIRPYRCLHVGDLVEVPVIYPDYLFHYYDLEESQLYLPARIIDVQDDQYLVKFSPAVIAYKWWPGRSSGEFPRKPGAKETVKNPFVETQVTVSMDRVRPYAAGMSSHPVLGTQSIRPQSWSAFQGIQYTDLQQFDENVLWK
ncbi:hypothetical protein RclHR1_05260004 [Rhizophagus clarus]|uniref:Uncharacterized protein n=1 Tax=Rhizophagus clarus TaxID=94130 RepID=A0A2Z6S4R8_9GLOM|nr:hypothetical protein RclHR1_05260004 [Rhizophagus clarus]